MDWLYRRAIRINDQNTGWLSDWLDADDWWIGCTGELSSLLKVKRMLVDRNTGLGWLIDWMRMTDWLIGCGWLMDWLYRRDVNSSEEDDGWSEHWIRMIDWLDADDWLIDWMRMIDGLAVQERCQLWWRGWWLIETLDQDNWVIGCEWLSDWLDADYWWICCTGELLIDWLYRRAVQPGEGEEEEDACKAQVWHHQHPRLQRCPG